MFKKQSYKSIILIKDRRMQYLEINESKPMLP